MASSLPTLISAPQWAVPFWLTYFAWFAGELWIVARDRAHAGGVVGDRGSRRLIVLATLLALAGAFVAVRRLPMAAMPFAAEILLPAGLALMWTGLLLRHWAVRTLGRFFKTEVTLHDDHRLVGAGPYRRLRHPAYTGALVTCVGLGLALGNWVSLGVMALVPLLGLANRIRVEEASLRERFGTEWDAYCGRRWALLPPLW